MRELKQESLGREEKYLSKVFNLRANLGGQ
jgi:hypothetical protein